MRGYFVVVAAVPPPISAAETSGRMIRLVFVITLSKRPAIASEVYTALEALVQAEIWAKFMVEHEKYGPVPYLLSRLARK
jgi:hypothetical protein